MSKEKKVVQFDIKATGITKDDDGQEVGHITAYGAVFNNVDSGHDKILPSAFKRTIVGAEKRAKTRGKRYLFPMLWSHNMDELIGGWTDVVEDDYGLKCTGEIALATQRGREYYALAKSGMSDQLSIVYDIPDGGAKYDKAGVRELSEIRLYTIDPVVLAMNEETYVVGVKSLETKTVCGSTDGPIGPRDEGWDGSAAEKWIWSKALDDEGNVKAAIAKKYFMRVDGDTSLKGSYGYAFWINDHISVGGVKAVANALSGARNADAGEDTAGMKSKVETLYRKINAKYPDKTPLTPPWEDNGKARRRHMQKKSFADHYEEEMCEDLLEDLCDVWFVALLKSIIDAFRIGDEPESDVSEVFDALKAQFMKVWVAQALECNLAEYLASDDTDSPLNTMYGGGYSSYGYMSNNLARSTKLRAKAGRAISAANQASIDEHVKNIKALATKAKAAMKAHVQDMHDMVDNMAGSGGNTGNEEDSDDAGKSRDDYATKAGRAISAAKAQQIHDMAEKAMSIMTEHTKAVSNAADDFANTMQGAESPAFGDGEGVADDDQQEGRGKARQRRPYKSTPATQNERPHASTALEDVEIPASWIDELRLRKAV